MVPTYTLLPAFAVAALLLGLGAAPTAGAQRTDLDLVIPPNSVQAKTFDDWIVQRAWQNFATTDELEAQLDLARVNTKLAKRSWLDAVNANVNFSSQSDSLSIIGQTPRDNNGTPYLFPGTNYGLSVGLGGLLNNKQRTRAARVEERIAQSRLDQEKLPFRAEVLDLVAQYDAARDLLALRRQAEVDAETNYTLVKSLYEQGKAQFEDLAQASEVYYRAVEATSEGQSLVRRARIQLEGIVGVPMVTIDEARVRYRVQGRQ